MKVKECFVLISTIFSPVYLFSDPPIIGKNIPGGTDIPVPVFYLWADRWYGSRLLDATTQGIICLGKGSVPAVDSTRGRMFSFNGTDSRFACGSSTPLADSQSGVTMAIVARMTGAGGMANSNGALLFYGADNGGDVMSLRFNNTGSDKRLALVTGCGGNPSRRGKTDFWSNFSTGIAVNVPFFYLIQMDSSGNYNMVLNGVSDEGGGGTGALSMGCVAYAVTAVENLGGDAYTAQIGPSADIRAAIIWNVALSSAQRNAVYRTFANSGALQ